MKLSGIDGPVVCFDLETTGINSKVDRILELGFVKIENSKISDRKVFRFNPGFPIQPEASAVNGIYDKDVIDSPDFSTMAAELLLQFSNCYLMGFNIEKFDLKFMKEEFSRCGLEFSVQDDKIIDVYKIYQAMFNSKLTTLYSIFCGKKVQNAHSALGDVDATISLMSRFLDFDHVPKEWNKLREELAKVPNKLKSDQVPDGCTAVDGENKLIKDQNGNVIINFGKKHKNKSLTKLLEIGEDDYLMWILSDDTFQPVVKETIQAFLMMNNINVREPASRRTR